MPKVGSHSLLNLFIHLGFIRGSTSLLLLFRVATGISLYTLLDYYTKWVEAVPLPRNCATGVAASLIKVKVITEYDNCMCLHSLKIFMRMGLPRAAYNKLRQGIEEKV